MVAAVEAIVEALVWRTLVPLLLVLGLLTATIASGALRSIVGNLLLRGVASRGLGLLACKVALLTGKLAYPTQE